jgi:hypothetical protein
MQGWIGNAQRILYNDSVSTIIHVTVHDRTVADFSHVFPPAAFHLLLRRYDESNCNLVPVTQLGTVLISLKRRFLRRFSGSFPLRVLQSSARFGTLLLSFSAKFSAKSCAM